MVCRVCQYEFCFECGESYYIGHIRDKHSKKSTGYINQQNIETLRRAQLQQSHIILRQTLALRSVQALPVPAQTNRTNVQDRPQEVSILYSVFPEQVVETVVQPAPQLLIDAQVILANNIEVSLVVKSLDQWAVVSGGLEKTGAPLKYAKGTLIFDNLRITRYGIIQQRIPPNITVENATFSLRFAVAGRTIYSSGFKLYASHADLPEGERKFRGINHSFFGITTTELRDRATIVHPIQAVLPFPRQFVAN